MAGFKWVRWTVAAGAVAALAMLLIPVSYNKTTGQDVALKFSAPGLQDDDVKMLAQQFKEALEGSTIQVTAEAGDHDVAYTLHGFVPRSSDRSAHAVANAFTEVLQSRGYTASASVTPHVERVSGSVYAMAMNQVIRISEDGKTAAQLEDEIRDQLVAAGVPNPEVRVTDEEGKRRIEVRATAESHDPSQPLPNLSEPTIVLTRDGQDVAEGDRCEIQVKKVKHEGGPLQLTVDVNYKGTTGQAIVDNPDGLGDAGTASAIESQLHAQGLTDLRVTVTDGKIEINPSH